MRPRSLRFNPFRAWAALMAATLALAILGTSTHLFLRSAGALLLGSSLSVLFMSAYAWGRDQQTMQRSSIASTSSLHRS